MERLNEAIKLIEQAVPLLKAERDDCKPDSSTADRLGSLTAVVESILDELQTL